MCDYKELATKSPDQIMDNENFKSCFARSVAVNSQYKQAKIEDFSGQLNNKDGFGNGPSVNAFQDSPVRYRKNNRSASMDESRRFSCGSIVSRRALLVTPPKRNEIPVENIYNQNKIDTLQWQLKEIEKSRGMYKAVMKQIVTFLEKAHVSLEHLSQRLNRKNPVSRSKSEHHIVLDSENSSSNHDHMASWSPNKKPDNHPDEIPPEKLSQEAFRLLRTAQSLLSTQEPNLTSSEDLNVSDEPSDIEFLAQLAKEFPSDCQRPQRATSFSLSPKLILPDSDIRISTAFNRKLSLQLGEFRRNSETLRGKNPRLDFVVDSECHSLPPGAERYQADPLRPTAMELESRGHKTSEKAPPSSPATGSVSSTEDESGFSSMNSFQDIGLPLVNSTGLDEVSARSVLLKSMLHNNSDYSSLSNDSDHNSSLSEATLTASPRFKHTEKVDLRKCPSIEEDQLHSLSDVKLWQKPAQIQPNQLGSSPMSSHGNHKRWNSTPEPKNGVQSLKVLWV